MKSAKQLKIDLRYGLTTEAMFAKETCMYTRVWDMLDSYERLVDNLKKDVEDIENGNERVC